MSNLNELMQDKERYETDINRAMRLERLRSNPDFKILMEDGFLVQQALLWINQSCDDSLPQERRQAILHKAQSVGYLREFFSTIVARGEEAAARLPDIEAYITREEAQQ